MSCGKETQQPKMNHDEHNHEAGEFDFICFPATHESTEKCMLQQLWLGTYALIQQHSMKSNAKRAT